MNRITEPAYREVERKLIRAGAILESLDSKTVEERVNVLLEKGEARSREEARELVRLCATWGQG